MLRSAFGLISLLAALFAVPTVANGAARPPIVLAAASMEDALTAAADDWARAGHPRPLLSFAASSAAARQIRSGAPADLFVSADIDWMNVVDRAGLVVLGTRAALAGNRLVVVTRMRGAAPLTRATLGPVLSAGPLAMADPNAVPAGRYGRAALQRMGAWARVAPHVVRAGNVRAALALVERGAAPYGIVYRTDALAARTARVAGVFPAASHPAIVYPIARLTAGRSPDAEGFRRFLLSDTGRAILGRYGFARP